MCYAAAPRSLIAMAPCRATASEAMQIVKSSPSDATDVLRLQEEGRAARRRKR